MDMSRHDAEIGKAEAVLIFCILQGYEHDFPAEVVLEHPYPVICP
jgi:hypothetical protein